MISGSQRGLPRLIQTLSNARLTSFANLRSSRRLPNAVVPSAAFSTSMNEFLFNPSEEHAALRSTLRSFVQDQVEPQANDFNEREAFNGDLFQQLGELGVMGLTVPEDYGGAGLVDATAVAILHEELSYSDPAFCLSYLAHSLLLTHNLSINGNEAQKMKYLPSCSAAEIIGGMAMSEPNAGTDVLGMQTTATPDDADNPQWWTIKGTKMWITNGTLDGINTGDLFLVYAKTGQKRTDVTLFLVEKDMVGFTLGQQIKQKLGMRASPTAELVFDNVVVPAENVVGQVNGATMCMMRNLEIERLALAAMAIGIARRCVDEMKGYAHQRKAFGKSLYHFGQVQQMLAESYANYMAGKTYVYATAQALDLNSGGNTLNADGTKLYCATMAKQVADQAIQTMGGYGYVGEYNVERLWRDAKLLEIGGGTNQSHHKNMARDLEKMESQQLD
mmetsp:Transcript_16298/g.21323  ORF Transcript_16298/g.21323 Transcript_16298/m.21323 type:complete len:446 (-) Transcript_16298:47-1384(-)